MHWILCLLFFQILTTQASISEACAGLEQENPGDSAARDMSSGREPRDSSQQYKKNVME